MKKKSNKEFNAITCTIRTFYFFKGKGANCMNTVYPVGLVVLLIHCNYYNL